MTRTILALDFGGTKLSAALFGAGTARKERQGRSERQEKTQRASSLREALPTYNLLDLRRIVTPADADAAYELAAMVALARELLDGHAPAVVGVSFGGPVDYATGVVRLSHHVRGWERVPLRDRLAVEFGCPVAVDNDANVAALGEHRFGAGRGMADMMYVTVSTGVGGGWILGGRPWRGHAGLAGEIGHTVADPAGPLCLCGKHGCVERLASGPYMAADYAQGRAIPLPLGGARGGSEAGENEDPLPNPLPEGEGTPISLPVGGVRGGPEAGENEDPLPNPLPRGEGTPIPLPSGGVRGGSGAGENEDPLPNPLPRGEGTPIPLPEGEGISGRDVAEWAAAGDALAREILLRGAWALGVGLGHAANLINPQRFVLGGGVTKAGEAWWAEVRRSAAATALPEVRFDVVPAALGDDAPLWGALALTEEIGTTDYADFTD